MDKSNVFEVNAERGLSREQVRKARFSGQINTSVKPPSKSIKKIIVTNTFTYFNFVFAVIATLLCLVGSIRDITFLPIIIANTLIGIVQEIRAKLTLDRLNILNAPSASVVRDGVEKKVSAEWLVLNDVVIFRAGNQIPADAKVLSGEVSVNEALLTGEADEIKKKPGDKLMSGSFIVSGECRAQLIAVGADSYISQLTLQAKKIKVKEQSEIIRSLNRYRNYPNWRFLIRAAFLLRAGWRASRGSVSGSSSHRHDSRRPLPTFQCRACYLLDEASAKEGPPS